MVKHRIGFKKLYNFLYDKITIVQLLNYIEFCLIKCDTPLLESDRPIDRYMASVLCVTKIYAVVMI